MGDPRSVATTEKCVERFEITLRGMRYTNHRKNLSEHVGVIVPWRRIRLWEGNHALIAIVLDDEGRPAGKWWRPQSWGVPYGQRRTMRRVIARAELVTLANGSYDVLELDRDRGGARCGLVFMAALCAVLIFIQFGVQFPTGWGGFIASSLSLRVVTLARLLATPAFVGFILLRYVVPLASINVKLARFTSHGVGATLFNGEKVNIQRDDVKNIRGVRRIYLIESRDGTHLRVRIQRADFVLRDWMRELGLPPRKSISRMAAVLWTTLVCQVVGLVGAVAIAAGWYANVAGPMTFYLLIGIPLPTFIWWIGTIDGRMERGEESRRRKKRVAARRLSRAASSADRGVAS